MEIIVILALLVFIGFREYISLKERKDFLDRLMAKNFPEYKDNSQPEETKVDVKDTNVVDLDEAQDEIAGEE